MTAPPAAVPASKTVRFVYLGMIGGVVLLAIIGPIAFRARIAESGGIPNSVLRVLLGLSLAASILGLLLRRRVPKRSVEESADLFWTTAGAPALVMWSSIEAAGLLAIIAYMLSGSLAALAVGAVAVFIYLTLNPGSLEKP